MKPLCAIDDHDWVFSEGEEQMGLTEGYYCRVCGVNMDEAAMIHADIIADEMEDEL